jgi:thiosulfate dehydrogenase [quinone] large subunit
MLAKRTVPPRPQEAPAELRRLRRAFIPLRVFLAGTFLYAGLDKLTDPAFLSATGPGSIGSQLQAFVYASPLAPLVRVFAMPAPVAVGAIIALIEIAIGLGALTGLLFRPAAFGGLALSLLFWLTASWGTHPYYYGADLPFAAGWLAVLLAGDAGFTLAPRLDRFLPSPEPGPRPIGEVLTRRDALRLGLEAAILGIASISLGAVAWIGTGGPTRAPVRRRGAGASPAPSPDAGASAGPAASSGETVGQVAYLDDVQPHEAVAVTDPATGNPAFLFRLASGRVVCYDALCTHEDCPVEFDAHSELFVCPCHGAVFDPAHGARVLTGPTRDPLPELPLTIDPDTGAISITG